MIETERLILRPYDEARDRTAMRAMCSDPDVMLYLLPVPDDYERLRRLDLLKPPGVAETLDWAQALELVGARHLDLESATATLGAVLKYREDADRARDALDSLLAS